MSFLVFIIALLLLIMLTPIAVVFRLIKSVITLRLDSSWFWRLALAMDQLGNVVADDLFNWLLIRNDSLAPFGDEDETISSVLGKNHLAGNLTLLGRALRYLLHKLDSHHCVNAIEDQL